MITLRQTGAFFECGEERCKPVKNDAAPLQGEAEIPLIQERQT
jgi:hypothetical protein